ncbi:MAG: DNA-protecting protein DprA [Leptospiraceae bacterium]|nr:DNA-protecting protein DprA [Leptospiraceae bacterium]MCZ8346778.1 DNA-protecting protein DprA [Leptospiraceae bacterium]
MIPYSFFADSKLRTFVFKNNLQKEFHSLEDLGDKIISYMDNHWVQEQLEQSRIMDKVYLDKSCGFIDYYHDYYPSQLREIYDPPLVLYYLGNPQILKLEYSAIVGTRKASIVSLFATRKLVERIAQESPGPLGIVSGMALGIDKEAMQTAINLNLPTLGVLGTPAYMEYPFGNSLLYANMKAYDQACLVSELLPLDRYAKWTFPMRNRIITGIANKVYLMETPSKSGAMSSANNALDQNKEIFIFSDRRQENNIGGEQLINDGATRFGWEDLGIKGEIKHITEIESLDCKSSQIETGSAWESYSIFKKSSNTSQIENLGSGFYFIESN